MTNRIEDEAHAEADQHPVENTELAVLKTQVAHKQERLGSDGVGGHRVRFSAASWAGLLDRMPEQIRENSAITRREVFDIAHRIEPRGDLTATDLFTASFLWGTGNTGYGAARYRQIVEAAGDRLEPSLRAALDAAKAFGTDPDPVAGYAALYGGYDYKKRAYAGAEGSARIHKFGPAFFTKFLYFSTPGALILDNVLANAVKRRSGLEHLVTSRGRSKEWTPYRYATYLEWMRLTAAKLDVQPDLLELTLFAPPPHDYDEGVNAD